MTVHASTNRWKPYPTYKDSGVEWLGEIPAHWGNAPLFTVARERDVRNRIGEETNVLSLSYGRIVRRDVSDNFGLMPESFDTYQIVEANNVVLRLTDLQNDKRSLRVGLVTERGIITSAYVALDVEKHLETAYAFYLLHAYDVTKVFYTLGAGVRQTMKFEDLKWMPLLVPKEPEQRAIAAFLDRETAKIDALVVKKERLIELLQEKRAALITQAVTKGLNPTVPMKDSGVEWLDKVPAHWEVKRIAMAVKKITNGYVGPTRDILVDEGIRYLQSLHIKGGEIIFDKPYFVTEKWSKSHAKSILCEGDVLLVQTGDIGQCCAVPKEFEGCNCHALIILQFKKGLGSGFYLSAFLRSDYGRNALLLAQTGALHPHLECGKVREIEILLPPPNEQHQIMTYLDRETAKIDTLIAKVREGIEKLKEYRTALISAAVTGKIDVREVGRTATK